MLQKGENEVGLLGMNRGVNSACLIIEEFGGTVK